MVHLKNGYGRVSLEVTKRYDLQLMAHPCQIIARHLRLEKRAERYIVLLSICDPQGTEFFRALEIGKGRS